MLDVLEHLEDDGAALDRLRSSMNPGGHVVITVPALQALWSEHDEANHHFRRYPRRLLRGRLTEHGFEIVRLGYHFGWTVVAMLGRRLWLSVGSSLHALYRRPAD